MDVTRNVYASAGTANAAAILSNVRVMALLMLPFKVFDCSPSVKDRKSLLACQM